MTLLGGRRAVVTGGARGIGAGVVARFAELGATGTALDRSPGSGLPPGWTALDVDVRDEEAVRDALQASADRLGGLDTVVAAAGVVPSWQRPAELDLRDFANVLAINTLGVAATIKHAAPLLTRGGTIVVVASLNAWHGDPNLTSYVASKHAVLGIVRSAALALGPDGVRVNAVGPGPIATDALVGRMAGRAERTGLSVDDALAQAAAGTALRRIATVAEVADAIAFLASDLSSGITGQLLNVDCGIA